MTDFTKIVCLGVLRPAYTKKGFDVFAKVEFRDGKLSITGVEGPLPSGNAHGGCGQISMHMDAKYLMDLTPAPGWSKATVRQFVQIWDRWHLNDRRAGTPAQMAELDKHEFPGYPKSYYEWAKETLATVGLEPDAGYSYGSEWLRVDVPVEVLAFLGSLPSTDKQPAWV